MAGAQGTAGTQAGRPQPQTTGQSDNVGPFIRHSRQSIRPGYSLGGVAVAGTIDFPLAQAPGYLRWLDVTLRASGGVAGPGVLQPDSSTSGANEIGFLQMKDAYGTVVFSGNGFEMGYLVQLYGGQVGILNAADPKNWPVNAANLIAASGNQQYSFRIPFEIGGIGGYGTLGVGNAALQPALHIVMSSAGTIFSTQPTTAPTFTVTVDEAYYAIPVDVPDLEPPALGTTLQWLQMVCNPTVAANSSQRVQLPRLGGYLTTLILEARDSSPTPARTDAIWPALTTNARIRLYIDGVPVKDEMIDQRYNEMFVEFPNVTRPAGVVTYSFKNAESQAVLGFLDSLEACVATSPGSLVEVECTPWGAGGTGVATITAIIGQIVPKGQVVYGLEG